MVRREWAEAQADCRKALELAPREWAQRAQVEANLRQAGRHLEK